MIDTCPSHGRYTLRQATLADTDFVWALHAACFRDISVASFGDWDPDHARERITFMIRQGASIIQIGGVDAGFFRCFSSAKGWIELAELELLSTFRGRGVGTQIMADINAYADANKLQVELQVLMTNPAKGFYERMGYLPTHTKMYRPVGSEPSEDASA